MDTNGIISVAIGLAGVVGGVWGGSRFGRSQESDISVNTITILQARVNELERLNREKEDKITELITRVDILESLVTQRAEVEAMHVEVTEVKGIVTRIAERVGA